MSDRLAAPRALLWALLSLSLAACDAADDAPAAGKVAPAEALPAVIAQPVPPPGFDAARAAQRARASAAPIAIEAARRGAALSAARDAAGASLSERGFATPPVAPSPGME